MTDFVEKRLVVCEVVCDLTNGGVESVLLNYFSHIDRSVLDLHLMTYGVASEVCRKSFEDLGAAVVLCAWVWCSGSYCAFPYGKTGNTRSSTCAFVLGGKEVRHMLGGVWRRCCQEYVWQ